jgi:nitric oxide reductase NorD protein
VEEVVGLWWHRAVTRWAEDTHADAAVDLATVRRSIELLFRAGGGAATVRLTEAGLVRSAGPRSWLQRLAGSGQRHAAARLDAQALTLPARLAVFAQRELNRDLYLWLAALAAVHVDRGRWMHDNRRASDDALAVFPGLRRRHEALVQAHLAQRPAAPSDAEQIVGRVLRGEPVPDTAPGPHDVAPVWLWLWPAAPGRGAAAARDDPGKAPGLAPRSQRQDTQRLRARRVSEHRDRAALVLPFRAEALLSWSELVRVDRSTDDSDPDDAGRAARDLDELAVAPDGQACASRVRFDLDLPSAAADDLPLGPGLHLPEWDWQHQRLRPDWCAVQTHVARPGPAFVPPPRLQRLARRVQRRLAVLRGTPRWVQAQRDGDELDLDAWVRLRCAGSAGLGQDDSPAVFRRREQVQRDLATLMLADLSLSTEAHVDNDRRVIDVVRDALYVFGEALHHGGDAFELMGFSSVRRQHVRLQHLKGFDEAWNDVVRARLAALKPGYYTRMGAALRAATRRLAQRPERQRLLLLLTDGKPNDLDQYEGRYGLEDTRAAVREARAAGLQPFAVTIDEESAEVLPHLFGQGGFAVVRRPQDIVARLPQIYARLTRPGAG